MKAFLSGSEHEGEPKIHCCIEQLGTEMEKRDSIGMMHAIRVKVQDPIRKL
jgi:hypothetical protein